MHFSEKSPLRVVVPMLVAVAGGAPPPPGSVPGEPGKSPRTTMMAESPFDSYIASATVAVLLVGFLVSVLLIGGFLVVNLGLMSKRPEDRRGDRTPSDLGVLKSDVWPEAPYEEHVLPAEEEEKPAA